MMHMPRNARGQLLPGQTPPPGAGRAKNARLVFNNEFFQLMLADLRAHGAEVIEAVRLRSPNDYLKVCAVLMPRGGEAAELAASASETQFEAFTDEELSALLAALRESKAQEQRAAAEREAMERDQLVLPFADERPLPPSPAPACATPLIAAAPPVVRSAPAPRPAVQPWRAPAWPGGEGQLIDLPVEDFGSV